MYNSKKDLIKLNFENISCFYKDDIQKIRDFIIKEIPFPLKIEIINKFLNGKYIQDKILFKVIKQYYKEIKERSYLALAEKGWRLSKEQLNLIDEILNDLKTDREVVYLVHGAPGSGKTLIAIHLLLSTLNNNYKSLLTYRNNSLINSIKEIFDSIKPGLSSVIKFYSVGFRYNFTGVAEKNFQDQTFDIVIYDESQRMTKENIHYALKRGKITVFFYDENQILNIEEEGLSENFIKEAENQRKTIKQRFLKGYYRLEAGEEYHYFIQSLLENPKNVNINLASNLINNYDFKVFSNIQDFLEDLEKNKLNGFRVALIASFTESPGDIKNPKSIKNLRIDYPLYSGLDIYKDFNKKIYWLMDPKNDYVPFWIKGESNKLEKCTSIYGCQGFETDYVGLIWGRDLIYRNEEWKLGENCEDNIGKPSLKSLFSRAKLGDVYSEKISLKLLKNRYRIFLTRGIKGTYIFCEDQKTSIFLNTLYNELIINNSSKLLKNK